MTTIGPLSPLPQSSSSTPPQPPLIAPTDNAPALVTDQLSLGPVPSRTSEPPLSFAQPAWGSDSQLEATLRALEDLKGNRDGLWNNEDKAAGTPTHLLDRNPLANKLLQKARSVFDRTENIQILEAFVSQQETQWGQAVSALPASAFKEGDLFLTQKAIALARFDRHPSEVTEGFVQAKGSVMGEPIEGRKLFYQHWAAQGEPSGKTILISPGFQETGRNFYEQIQTLNQAGHDVMVMDHQWAGQSDGKAGGLDRGFGVARDVAAMAAEAYKVAQERHGKDAGLILYGNSMGGGPGVLGALTLQPDIQLEGAQMPAGLKAVLQAPFLEATPGILNKGVALGSQIPFLNQAPLPSMGLPVLTHDKVAAQKVAQGAVLENTQARLQAMTAAVDDLAIIKDKIQAGQGPDAGIRIVHGDQDPLAHVEGSQWLQKHLADAKLHVISSENHVLQESPTEQHHVLQMIQDL